MHSPHGPRPSVPSFPRQGRLVALLMLLLAAASGVPLVPASAQTPADSPSASVSTDWTDYQPGDTVVITGSGFEPGEIVRAVLTKDGGAFEATFDSVADEYGNFVNTDYAPGEEDLGAAYELTVTGLTSGRSAVTRFTDGTMAYAPPHTSLDVVSGATAQVVSRQFNIKTDNDFPNAPTTSITLGIGLAYTGTTPLGAGADLPSGWVAFTPTTQAYTGKNQTRDWDYTVTVPANTTPGTYRAYVRIVSGLPAGQSAADGSLLTVNVTAPAVTDTTPPLSSASAATTPGGATYLSSTWTTENVVVTLSATDYPNPGGAGVASIKYQVNGGGYSTYSTPFTISSEGISTIQFFATDNANNAETAQTFVVKIDRTAPALDLPSDITDEATGPDGATVNYTASATDDVEGAVTPTCSPASGSTFPLGTTTVECSAADSLGNSSNGSFTVTVQDTTAPELSLPSDITAEATGPSGAAVTFSATASDLVDGAITPSCAPPSGSTFALGTTEVDCSATDAHGNTASGSFAVTVEDTTPPTVTVPVNVTKEATGPNGATATFSASATDLVDGPVGVTCIPASGSTFPLGTTTVTCSATDARGNTGSNSFTVTVQDTTPPALSLPSNISVTATSTAGNVVTFSATATDIVDGSVPVVCVPASGSVFPLGTTVVNCSATDAHGNTGAGSFTVTVSFSWTGFLQPINAAGTRSSFRLGSTIPVKFQLTGASAGIGNGVFTFSYLKIDNSASPTNESEVAATPTAGNQFRYDATAQQYIYNWSTRGLTSGTYRIYANLGDGVQRSIEIDLR